MGYETMTVWLTSDAHLGHEAIITKAPRPFIDVNEMDSVILQNFHEVVRPEDDVYILGDFAWKVWYFHEVLPQLPGNIYYIPGNHDEKILNVIKRHVTVLDRLSILKLGGVRVVLSHYPLASWYNSGDGDKRPGTWHFHGHLHGSTHHGNHGYFPRRVDVGVDAHNYYPISLEQILDEERYETLKEGLLSE
jgi:calcineurin-like phosphoesterase family protein